MADNSKAATTMAPATAAPLNGQRGTRATAAPASAATASTASTAAPSAAPVTTFATLAGMQASTAAPATAAPSAAAVAAAAASPSVAPGTAAPSAATPASAKTIANAAAGTSAGTQQNTATPAFTTVTAAPAAAPAFVPGTAAPLRAGGAATPSASPSRSAAAAPAANAAADANIPSVTTTATARSTSNGATNAATNAASNAGTPAQAAVLGFGGADTTPTTAPSSETDAWLADTDADAVPQPVQQAADQMLARRGMGMPRPETTFSGAALAAAAAPGAGTAVLATSGDSGATPSNFTSLHQLNLGGAIGAAQQQGQPANVLKLSGEPEQWQQPLRAALGDRLQLQLQRGSDQAVITLDPPNMGRVEIAIRHSQGSLQVAITANNSEVLRQLNTISDSVRQDLAQRNFTDVTVTVASASRGGGGQNMADGGGNARQQQGREQEQRNPGRALSEGDTASSTFAMNRE